MARRSNKSSKVYAISIGVHLVIGLAIAFIPKDKLKEIIAISMGESNKPKPPPPKREDRPHETKTRVAAAHVGASHSTSTIAAAAAAAPVFTDIGISMDANGSEGVAVATAPKAPPPPKMLAIEPAKPKVLAARTTGDCDEPLVKARPERVVRPEFTTEARTAGVDGVVMIDLEIDDRGDVISAKVRKGLGHGLDESSLEAAKKTHFIPATRCGKPVAAPLVIKMRFSLAS
ncbi:MAG TPA: energy transducer TonB [Polyangiaceae bacterium]|nr:energy transducer TonB [Polyangiaceae bacterium]